MRIQSPLLLTLGLTAIFATTGCPSGDDETDDVTPMGVRIDSFSADKTTVASGAMVVLSYQVSNATSVSIAASPGGALLTESTNFMGTVTSAAITETTTFTLTANGTGGPKTQTVMVTVDQNAVEILTFTATPNPAAVGSMVRLAWTTAGATQVRLLEGTTELHNTTTSVATGSFMVTLDDQPHTYRLEASNAAATDTMDLTVTIAEGGRVTFFRVSPTVFTGSSANVTVVWNARGEEFSLTANGNAVPEFTGTNTGTITVSVTGTTLFQLSAMGAGETDTAFAAVAQAVDETEPNNDIATATPITGGATGMIDPADDLDFYSFTVPAGGNVFAETSDGMGGCTLDTVIRLYDSTGAELTSNDQDGPDDCSQINPRFDFFARDLAAGTYYISVEAYNASATGNYALVVIASAGACGNALVERSLGEQCDDGNTTAGDGCSPTCQVQVLGTVTGLGQNQMFDEVIDPANQVDVYQVVLSEPGFIFAETGAPTVGMCEGGADTILELLDSTFTQITQNDDIDLFGDPPNWCSRIDPAENPFASVPAGTYYLSVRTYSQVLNYQLQVRTIAPGCGNAILERDAGEQCDDGATAAGDGCSATCTIETFGTINPPGGMVSVPAFGDPEQPVSFVEVVLTSPGQSITATTTDGAGGCPFPTALVLGTSDLVLVGRSFGDGGCAFIDPLNATAGHGWATNLAPGSYLLGVYAEEPADMGMVTVQVTIANPECGNGFNETRANEQCDDGNTANGDGCSGTCRFEGNVMVESEPNNDALTADTSGAAINTTATMNGSIDPAADVDWWAVTVPQGATLIARTYPIFNDPASCDRIQDTKLYLIDSNGMELAMNDDDETRSGWCSAIDGTYIDDTGMLAFPEAANLAAGTYYIRVEAFDSSQTFQGYFLQIRLQ